VLDVQETYALFCTVTSTGSSCTSRTRCSSNYNTASFSSVSPDLSGLKSLSYTERLLRLNLESLESRHVKADLVLLFKVIHGFIDIDYSAMFDIQYDRTTRSHDLRIRKCHSNVDARKFHFCNRVIDVWNNRLSSYQVHLPSVNAFKKSLAHSVF